MTEYSVAFFLYIICMGLAYTNLIKYKSLIFLLDLLPFFFCLHLEVSLVKIPLHI